jgi:hypothetical protein
MSTENCDENVYRLGVFQGFYDMPKADAEEHCRVMTARTGYKHDWHYFGGRVRVLALLPEFVQCDACAKFDPEATCPQCPGRTHRGEVKP